MATHWRLPRAPLPVVLQAKTFRGALNTTKGVELEIRRDSGESIIVVQKQGKTVFSKGQRVRIAGQGNNLTVSPRQ